MFRFSGALATIFLLASQATYAQTLTPYAGLGRAATAAELKAWDIDVRPDFKGLPAGQGSAARGQEFWESKCESCHGVFGESNHVFTPISGGVGKKDSKSGRVAELTVGGVRSTFMKLSQLATLWDYVNRAMPWNAPKSLSSDDVYAVVAYMMHLNEMVPLDFSLSDKNIAQMQQRLPNRNGMSTAHGLWAVNGKPDVKAKACMSDCVAAETHVKSSIPDFARNAHGNLTEQFRLVGGARGADTTQAAAASAQNARRLAVAAAASNTASNLGSNAAGNLDATGAGATATTGSSAAQFVAAQSLAEKKGCLSCHGVSNRLVGPALQEVAAKYKDRADALTHVAQRIALGGQGVWGAVPMPPQPQLSADDVASLSRWIMNSALPK